MKVTHEQESVAALMKAGMSWTQAYGFAQAAQNSYMTRVLAMELDEFKDEILPTAPGWIKANVGDDSWHKNLQDAIQDMLPGERMHVSYGEVCKAYRKITSVQEALFGPQISSLDYLRELNPGLSITVNHENDLIVLESPDRIGISTFGKTAVAVENSASAHASPYERARSSKAYYVQRVFTSMGPLSRDEFAILRRFKRNLPDDVIRVAKDGLNIAWKKLEERGLLACHGPEEERTISLRLTDLGLDFIRG